MRSGYICNRCKALGSGSGTSPSSIPRPDCCARIAELAVADFGVVLDMDTPEDYRTICSMAGGRRDYA